MVCAVRWLITALSVPSSAARQAWIKG
jgi:hypothetical protein